MTVEEKKEVVNKYCDTHETCITCPLFKDPLSGQCTNTEGEIEYCYKRLLLLREIKPPVEPVIEHDPVNHPSHDCRENAMECIDEMILLFGKEVVKHFCLCNAWKYRARAMNKNGEEDLRKSDWYIKKYRELSDIG